MLNKQKLRKFLEGCKNLKTNKSRRLKLDEFYNLEAKQVGKKEKWFVFDVIHCFKIYILNMANYQIINEETIEKIINWISNIIGE